jgi:hypothetical protein
MNPSEDNKRTAGILRQIARSLDPEPRKPTSMKPLAERVVKRVEWKLTRDDITFLRVQGIDPETEGNGG